MGHLESKNNMQNPNNKIKFQLDFYVKGEKEASYCFGMLETMQQHPENENQFFITNTKCYIRIHATI